MTNTKMTNKVALTFVLDNCEIPTDVREKLEKMLEQTVKKSGGSTKTMTATQKANEVLKTVILDNMIAEKRYTVTDLIKEIAELDGLSNQKVSRLVNDLDKAKLVEKVVDKRRSYFVRHA